MVTYLFILIYFIYNIVKFDPEIEIFKLIDFLAENFTDKFKLMNVIYLICVGYKIKNPVIILDHMNKVENEFKNRFIFSQISEDQIRRVLCYSNNNKITKENFNKNLDSTLKSFINNFFFFEEIETHELKKDDKLILSSNQIICECNKRKNLLKSETIRQYSEVRKKIFKKYKTC